MHLKHSLTYFPHFLVPLMLLGGLNYLNGLRSVDATLSTQVQNQLNSLSGAVDARLRNERFELSRVALSGKLRELLTGRKARTTNGLASETLTVPNDLFLDLTSLLRGRGHCYKVAVFDEKRTPLFQIERAANFQSADSFLVRYNSAGITLPPVDPASKEAALNGQTLLYVVPISYSGPNSHEGTLVAEMNVEEVIADAAGVLEDTDQSSGTHRTFVTALDSSAKIVYLKQHDREGMSVSSVMPEFLSVAELLSRKNAGVTSFRGATGQNFTTAYSPLPQWNLGLAVGLDKSALSASAHLWGILGLLLALAGAVIGALVVSYQAQKKGRGLERLEEGLTAIAGGQLDRRIDLKSSDDARVIADNINVMTERLRTQIAREEETRQFQSFVRLSAMLTHDLKNAIEALSLIVGNMERHFDNEQFRRDALTSLTSATAKLQGIVARLTRPLTSLSGEHPRPKSVDLVPIIKRVASLTAEHLRELHKIQINLPPNLFVFTDPERIERVIENLIINALEAMGNNPGILTISAGLTSRGAATFSIQDTGPGMSRVFIDHQLFRPFATTKRHGVGLGLYTCREVVEASAGTIEVESVESVGTTFRVVLPSASHD